MTTPESDPYAESGGSDWEVRPAVPGWNVGQDFLTGPIFDDTGWHIDLSNVDWAGSAAERQRDDRGRQADGYGPPVVSSRYDRHDLQAGNGEVSYPAGPGAPAERTGGWPEQPPARTGRPEGAEPSDRPERRAGRHARHSRPAEPQQRPGQRPDSGGQRQWASLQEPRTRSRRSPERRPDEPGYQPPGYDPAGYQGAGYESPPAQEAPGYERPGYEGPRQRQPLSPPGPSRPGQGRPRVSRPSARRDPPARHPHRRARSRPSTSGAGRRTGHGLHR